jgi:hypothetical protein
MEAWRSTKLKIKIKIALYSNLSSLSWFPNGIPIEFAIWVFKILYVYREGL